MADQAHGSDHAADAAIHAADAAHASSSFFADPTFWATVAVAIFLLVLVWQKVPGALAKSLDERADKIKDELDNARKLREQAQALLSDAEKRQAEADADAQQIIADAKTEASQMVEDARAELKEKIARREKAAEERIARAEADATQQVRQAAADAASRAAAALMGDNLKGPAAKAQFADGLEQVKKALS